MQEKQVAAVVSRSIKTFATVLALVLVTSCGGGEPEQRTWQLDLQDRALTANSEFEVKQGDTLIIHARSDEIGSLHLHGYDTEILLMPGVTTDASVTAYATGRFDLEFHLTSTPGQAHKHEHEDAESKVVVGELRVLPR